MTTLAQRSFAGGEVAPALYARSDQTKYMTGVRTLRNCYVMRHAGSTNRPGTSFVGEVKDSTKTVRLIPFEFNTTQTCMLEFGDLYMRIHQNGAQVTDILDNITGGITNANPCVITAAVHGLSTGNEVAIAGIVGPIGTFLNGRNFKVVVLTGNTFSLQYMNGAAVDSTAFGAYTSGGTVSRIYTIVSPFAATDLPQLRYAQSGDVITFAHPSYAPQQLTRSGATSWAFATFVAAPATATPTGGAIGIVGAGGANTNYDFALTAVNDETGEESLPNVALTNQPIPATFTSVNISASAVTGCSTYRVYAAYQGKGIYGFIGYGGAGGIVLLGAFALPNFTLNPPTARNPFSGANNYPSAVAYIQQRLSFGNSNNNPENVWTSQTGRYANFCRSFPTADGDAITFTLAGTKVNPVKHLLELGKPLIFTSTNERACEGDAAGIIKPSAINPKPQTYNGSGDLAPLIVGGNAIYLQSRGSIVRDLSFEFQSDTYRGNDLTIFSAHLVDGHTIVDWCYQQQPHSLVWAVRDDGVLLCMTYVREHQIIAWSRHDTDGIIENVASIPEGTEDAVYMVVKRTINGATKRYVERLNTRLIKKIADANFMDCSLTYDGRNTGPTTMTLTSAGTWTYDDTLTLTHSLGFFVASDVGKEIHIDNVDASGNVLDTLRCVITAYTSATVVSVKPSKTVPAALRSVATLNWGKAITALSGLWNIEAKAVSVLGDGFVCSSPNNTANGNSVLTVASGQITLAKAHRVIHVGLPYLSDIYSLDVENAAGESLADKGKLVEMVTAHVENTRGVWAGTIPPESVDGSTGPTYGLEELKIRNDEELDEVTTLAVDQVQIRTQATIDLHGRIFIRQVDPLPMSILAVEPSGDFPGKVA